MDIRTATVQEMQTNFAKYLGFVANGGEVIVTDNGKEVGRFIPRSRTQPTGGGSEVDRRSTPEVPAKRESSVDGFAGGEHLTPLTDSLLGILKSKEDPDKAREEELLKKYANPD